MAILEKNPTLILIVRLSEKKNLTYVFDRLEEQILEFVSFLTSWTIR